MYGRAEVIRVRAISLSECCGFRVRLRETTGRDQSARPLPAWPAWIHRRLPGAMSPGDEDDPMRADTEHLVEEIEKSLALLRQRLGYETVHHRLEELTAMTEDPDLWNDPARARKVMRDRQMLADALESYESMVRELADQQELIELGEAEGDTEVIADAE